MRIPSWWLPRSEARADQCLPNQNLERVVENEPATIQIQPARGYLVNRITFDTCGTGSLSGLTFTMDDRPDETFRSRFQ